MAARTARHGRGHITLHLPRFNIWQVPQAHFARCSTPMNWGLWLHGAAGILAAAMFVQMKKYHHPVACSNAVRFFACRGEGFARQTIKRRPFGHL